MTNVFLLNKIMHHVPKNNLEDGKRSKKLLELQQRARSLIELLKASYMLTGTYRNKLNPICIVGEEVEVVGKYEYLGFIWITNTGDATVKSRLYILRKCLQQCATNLYV